MYLHLPCIFFLQDTKFFPIRENEILPFKIHPPESLWNPHHFYFASDVWLLGIAFWEMFHIGNGNAFYFSQSAQEHREFLYSTMVDAAGKIPLKFEGKIPKALRDLIIWCCEFDLEKRPLPEDIIHRIGELEEGNMDFR